MLHLGMIQMPISRNPDTNIRYFEARAKGLCRDPRRPHLIIGVEFGISPDRILDPAGPEIKALQTLAASLQAWLIPGSLKLAEPGGGFSNAAPVLDPEGNLAGMYKKMVPWDTDLEAGTIPGREYLTFDMQQPNVRCGLQICFDADFPEISRTLTLMGSEVLIQLSMDPDSIPKAYECIKYARAMENQAYYIYMNGSGEYGHYTLGGRSLAVSSEGHTLFAAGEQPTASIVSLDLTRLRHCRQHGSWDQVAQLKALRQYTPAQPWAGHESGSPVFSQAPFADPDRK
jgi:predicted amidohydrolase